MRRRWASSRRRGRKRATSWLAGVTTYDSPGGQSSRLISLTTAGFVSPNVWGSVITPVANTDLPSHGGEDCVLTRMVGRLGFMEGRKNAGAGFAAYGFQLRVAVVQGSEIAGTATVLADELVTSAGMGKENILYMRDVIVPSLPIGAAGTNYDIASGGMERWLDIDIRAKRRVSEDSPILLWFETCLPAGTTAADFRLLGGLRTLLMRPR